MLNRWLWLVVTYAACTLVIGIPYWQAPYNTMDATDLLLGPTALFVVAVAALCRVFAPAPLLVVATIVAAAVVTVVVLRIGFDTAIDPTTHNLAPFEVILALVGGGIEGLVAGLLGSGVEYAVRRLRGA